MVIIRIHEIIEPRTISPEANLMKHPHYEHARSTILGVVSKNGKASQYNAFDACRAKGMAQAGIQEAYKALIEEGAICAKPDAAGIPDLYMQEAAQ